MHPEIILGPPGTGKTTKLLSIVDDELNSGLQPEQIGYVSFTRKAADEAMERACEKFGFDRKRFPYFRTLHSLCFHALSMSNSDIFEGKKILEFGDSIGIKFTEFKRMDESTMFGFSEGDRALFMDNLARVMCVPLRELYNRGDDDISWTTVDYISRSLDEYKKKKGLMDFTDMLIMFVQQDWSPPIEVLLVDEAQDLSILQWRVVEKLAQKAKRVVFAGDDDQAIYRWAGAAVDHFVDMAGDVTVLNQSWRVPKAVQRVADGIIGKVKHRRPKEWNPREDEGDVQTVSGLAEIDLWTDDILFLSRNGYTLRKLENYLKAEGVLYEIRGASSIKKATLNNIKLWEHLRAGGSILAEDAVRIYSMIRTGHGVARGYKQLPGVPADKEVDIDWLKQYGGLTTDDIWHKSLNMMDANDQNYLLRALQKGEKLGRGPRIRLSTIHGSKGGQADHVVLMPDMARRTYKEYELNPEDEARVWYVGATRAKQKLTLFKPYTKLYYPI